MTVRPWVGVAVLREIAVQHPGGADDELIGGGISVRDDEIVPGDELRRAIGQLQLAGLVRQRGGRWHLTDRALAYIPKTASGALSVFSEEWRAYGRARIAPLFTPERQAVGPVKHGAIWFDDEEKRGARIVHERYDPERDLLAVVYAKKARFNAVVYEKREDVHEWPVSWRSRDRDSWFSTREDAVGYLERVLARPPSP